MALVCYTNRGIPDTMVTIYCVASGAHTSAATVATMDRVFATEDEVFV